ncbi:MAG: CoA transferase, partial [Dehalococcoidia bacterium]|nr:CoA transferase [Dehalococcoidia bacterium]
GPLSGIRILDVSSAVAGPYGAMILSDLGAEVIKVESPDGDRTRKEGLAQSTHLGQSYFFMAMNRNKKGMTLDLLTDTGRDAFYDLVRISDVVWDNFRPGVMERLKLDYDTLKQINKRIISCSVSGFGQTGPYRERGAVDLMALGLSGVLSVTGEPGGPPIRPGPPEADLWGGAFGAHGVMAALYERERTGVGQRVDIGLLDGQISNLTYYISYYFCSGLVPHAMGTSHLSVIPFRAYNTKNGWLVIGPSWPRLARVMGLDWMIDDPRFVEKEARVVNRQAFDDAIQERLMQESAEDWLQLFYAEDVRAAPVNTIDRAVIDPQVLHRNMIVNIPHPLGGEVRLVGNPIKMPDSIVEEYTAPPLLGQHNEEILAELLKYPEEKIRRLREEEEAHREELMFRIEKAR